MKEKIFPSAQHYPDADLMAPKDVNKASILSSKVVCIILSLLVDIT